MNFHILRNEIPTGLTNHDFFCFLKYLMLFLLLLLFRQNGETSKNHKLTKNKIPILNDKKSLVHYMKLKKKEIKNYQK